MRKIALFLGFLMIFYVKSLMATTTQDGPSKLEVSGEVSGIWNRDTIYEVVGSITIPKSDTLIIEPGTVVKFDTTKMVVHGVLLAVGTETDSILFTSIKESPASGDWMSIFFDGNSDSGSFFSHCIIEYGNRGLFFNGIKAKNIQIKNSSIRKNFPFGIYCYDSSPVIESNLVVENNHGIECYNFSSPTVSNNKIAGNHTGIGLYDESSPVIISNSICRNKFGIHCDESAPYIMQNSIFNNEYPGIYSTGSSSIINGNLLYGNLGGGIDCDHGSPTIHANTIYQNHGGIGYQGLSAEITANVVFQNLGYGISIRGENPGNGIYAEANIIVADNTIYGNSDNGIDCGHSSSKIIKNFIYENVGAGIDCNYDATQIIRANTIFKNSNGGINLHFASIAKINGNTIWGNIEYGIRIWDISSSATITNNIICENATGIYSDSDPCTITYNNIFNNGTNFDGSNLPVLIGQLAIENANGDPVDPYLNLSQDPEMVDPENADFTLKSTSPCIEAGDSTFVYNETGNHDSGWRVDIGACEYQGTTTKLTGLQGGRTYFFGGQVRAKIALAAEANFDSIWITVYPGETHPNTASAVQRWYEISAQGSGNFDLTLSYKDTELNGQTESELKFWHLATTGYDGPKLSATANTTENWLTVANQSEFSTWIISEASTVSALPVELAAFGATVRVNQVLLNWQTTTETNNYGFEVQRLNENQWETIDFVSGNGTTAEPQSYEFIDNLKNIPAGEKKLTYRLKQIDTDGSFEYSQTIDVVLNLLPQKTELAQNYPNPFNPTTKITYALAKASLVKLTLYDVLGREIDILENDFKPEGNYNFSIALDGLPTGIYFYKLETEDFVDIKKMIFMQ